VIDCNCLFAAAIGAADQQEISRHFDLAQAAGRVRRSDWGVAVIPWHKAKFLAS